MFSCNPGSLCEPYPLRLLLTVIHPRALCTFAAGVSAILQHTAPASPPHSYTAEPCLYFPACNQPWLRHTAADQFFSFNPTAVPNHHTHIPHTSSMLKSQTLQYSHLPNLDKMKKIHSLDIALSGLGISERFDFVKDMTLLHVSVSSINQQ